MGRIFTEHLQVRPHCFPGVQACLHICTPVSWWLAACLTTFLYTLQGRVFTCRLCGNHLASNLELISKASRAPFHHCSHTPVCTLHQQQSGHQLLLKVSCSHKHAQLHIMPLGIPFCRDTCCCGLRLTSEGTLLRRLRLQAFVKI